MSNSQNTNQNNSPNNQNNSPSNLNNSNTQKKFLFIDSGQPFNLDQYKDYPIGGSEASCLMLAKGVSELGNSVVILNNTKTKSSSHNIIIDNINLAEQYIPICDVVVLNRFITLPLIKLISNLCKKIYYYSHDAYDQEIVSWLGNNKENNLLQYINKFMCVSQWQLDSFIKNFNIIDTNLTSKFTVLPNSVDKSLYYGYKKRDPNKLIFASIPYKGLEFLNDIINDLVIRTKNKDLKLHVFSDMKLYGTARFEENNQYEEIYRTLDKNPNIVLRNLVSMKDLAVEFATSNLYIHPNVYHETFCMSILQAQAAGCLPVITDYGAVREVVENQDNIIPEPNIYLHGTYTKFIEKTIELLNKSEKEINLDRIKATQFAQQFDYLKISKRFLDLI